MVGKIAGQRTSDNNNEAYHCLVYFDTDEVCE